MIVLGVVALLATVGLGLGGGWVAYTLGNRWLSLAERKQAELEKRTRSLIPPTIPPELMRRIMKWGDVSAQELERAAILGLYEEFRDAENPWAKVKAHLPPEPRETVDSALLN